MAANLLLNLALSDAEAISVCGGQCKRVRFRQSECRRCVDVCPEHAITLDSGPTINECCSQCGLCVNVCPTEVFQETSPKDAHLLERIKALLDRVPASTTNKTRFFIHCQEAEQPHEHSCRVTCLGNLNENVMLGANLMGLDEMVLAKGSCAQCHLAQGQALLLNAMEAFSALQHNMDLRAFTLHLVEKPKDKACEERLSRRRLFSRISENVREKAGVDPLPASNVTSSAPDPSVENRHDKRASVKRAVLRDLLCELPSSRVSSPQHSLPWGIMKVDEENCIGCGICVAVCPTGALVKEYAENQLVRYYNSALCSSCALCEEACPQKVIRFEETTHIGDFVEDNTRVVARVDLNACMICGEIIPVKEGKICTTCQKRQVAPLFL
jgi:ferredoxin